jgi:ELWxxDGT repeat protein
LFLLSGCGGGGGGSSSTTPGISSVNSSVFSKTGNVYPTGRVVRIDVQEQSGGTNIAGGTIRIRSSSQGYDSGVQSLSFGSIFYNWDTTGLTPASDYVVEVTLIPLTGPITTDKSLTITLTPNPPAINKLVSEADLVVPARGIPIAIVRTYLLDSGFDGPLGYGWTHTYFEAYDGAGGRDLWKSDGTAAGTSRVAVINPLGILHFPSLTAIGNALYFSGTDGVTGFELWRSN